MCPIAAWNNAHFVQLNKLRNSTLRVHRLCFHALTLMFQDNYRVQMYFAKQHVLVAFKWTPKEYARLAGLARRNIKDIRAGMLNKHGVQVL